MRSFPELIGSGNPENGDYIAGTIEKKSITMVDRVARAILIKVPLGYGMTVSESREYARVAIEAMRLPTQEMVNAAWIDEEESPTGVLVREFSVSHDKENVEDDTAGEVWMAMIDAALKE